LTDVFPLRRGAHPSREDGMCAMEMVAWLAGEPHSDCPDCASPVLAAVVRAVNDRLPDDGAREWLLRPLVPRLVNSRADAGAERARALAIVDFVLRRFETRSVGTAERDAALWLLKRATSHDAPQAWIAGAVHALTGEGDLPLLVEQLHGIVQVPGTRSRSARANAS
jgi:hypothetical protein